MTTSYSEYSEQIRTKRCNVKDDLIKVMISIYGSDFVPKHFATLLYKSDTPIEL